jgi:hypothetical protein
LPSPDGVDESEERLPEERLLEELESVAESNWNFYARRHGPTLTDTTRRFTSAADRQALTGPFPDWPDFVVFVPDDCVPDWSLERLVPTQQTQVQSRCHQ